MFDVAGWRSSCEAAAQGMRESVKTFRELLDHLSEVWKGSVGESVGENVGSFSWGTRCTDVAVWGRRTTHESMLAFLTRSCHMNSASNLSNPSACLLLGSTTLLPASPLQGLRFYIGTSDVVKKTLQEAQDFVFTRGVQREELKQVRLEGFAFLRGSAKS